MKRTRHVLAGLAGFAGILTLCATSALADWPEKPLTMICPWSAGGGTDATARLMAKGLEDELGVVVNVVNKTGAGGLIGHNAIATAKPDGYTIGLATSVIGKFHWVGQADLTYKDLTPLMQFNMDATALFVKEDSPYKTLGDAIADFKKSSSFKMAGTSLGMYHLNLVDLLLNQKIDAAKLKVVAIRGTSKSLTELAAGGVDLVPGSLPEGKGLMEAGKIRALAVFDDARHPVFPDVPTVKEAIGADLVGGAWRGIVAPKGIPADVKDKLVKALKAAYESDAFQSAMKKGGFGLKYGDATQFESFLAANDKMHGQAVKLLEK